MRRGTLIILVAIATMLVAPFASARSLTVRSDPDDATSRPDIRTVSSDVSGRRIFLRVGAWERLREADGGFWIALDTRSSRAVDRLVKIGGGRCVVQKLNDGAFAWTIGSRDARRPDDRSVACDLPTEWFRLRPAMPVRFFVVADRMTNPDRAPNADLYRGL